MGAIDIVYLLGNESPWKNKEILFSIRSVAHHMKGYRKIFIVGDDPGFFTPEITIIPFADMFGNKAHNIQAKIMRAAADERVSKNFMVFNDDYFILQPTTAPGYPYYYKNTLTEALAKNPIGSDYLPHLQATINELSKRGDTLLNFDSHYPIIYNKGLLRYVCDKFDWNMKYGYIMKSTYCNTLGIAGQYKADCKISHPHIYWDRVTKGMEMFSIGDRSINKSLEQFLSSIYPRCKYEK